jgi:hypothetical protein
MTVLNRRVGYLFHRPAAEAQDSGLPVSNIYPNSQSSITGLDLSCDKYLLDEQQIATQRVNYSSLGIEEKIGLM